MGGVLINGCGAADTFKKLVKLKVSTCPACRKEREFYLAKVQMKIHVAFIPTLPINTKYGIICGKCKSGIIISEQQMHQLMCADEMTRETLFDVMMNGESLDEAQDSNNTLGIEAPQAESEVQCPRCSKMNSARACFCSHCGAKIDVSMIEAEEELSENGAEQEVKQEKRCPQCAAVVPIEASFCGYCGARLDAPASEAEEKTSEVESEQEVKQEKQCPQCAAVLPADACFCGHCGTKIETVSPKMTEDVSTVNIVQENASLAQGDKGMWTCSLCGEKNPEGESSCYLCGQKRS